VASEAKSERLRTFLASGKWNAVLIVDAILESPLSHSEKLTLIAIASHRSDSNTPPSPGLRRLAELTSQKPHTVAAAVARLSERRILRALKRERQVNTYDLGGTMAGILAVYPNGTESVPIGDTASVPLNGTERPREDDPSCADRGYAAVPIGDPICADRGHVRNHEGTIEGTSSASASEAGPFALSSPSAEQSSKATKRRPKAATQRADPEHGTQHAKVVAFYFETFEAKRGTKPPFDGADGTAVKKLLEKLGGDAERACAAIAGAFADDWTAARTSIRAIASDPAKFIGAQAQVRKTNGRATPTQPNYGIAIDAEEYR
jgi:hypothetical protein